MEINYISYAPSLFALIASIVAIVCYKKFVHSNEKYFLHLIVLTVVVDVLGGILGYVFSLNNFWLYNFFTIGSFLFYFTWYSRILRRKSFKRIIIAFYSIFCLVAISSLLFQSWKEYHAYTFFTGAAFLLVLTLFHFHQLLNSNEVLIVKYKLSFWISTALLLFYMGMIPVTFLLKYMDVQDSKYLYLLIALNLVFYGCYIIGFLWTKKKYNHF
ncbi:MAG: hypothetical protein AAF489_10250 [Bacteroidota bacterium]